jgi:hypothetical protein
MGAPITPLIVLIGELAMAKNFKAYQYQGTWRYPIDEYWTFELNPHKHAIKGIPAYHAAIYYNDFPAGMISPQAEVLAMGGEVNRQNLKLALKGAVRREKERADSNPGGHVKAQPE